MEGFVTPVKNKPIDSFTIPQSPFLKRLGYGTGINVYKFERSPKCDAVRSPWALKMFKKTGKNSVLGARLRTEAEILRKMDHPNIVSFRGFVTTGDGRECLAMEDCHVSLGDLIEIRNEEKQVAFEVDKIMKVAFHISKALDYIHNKILLLHGDIKSYNILIKNNFKICKLCDFGVSLPLKNTGYLDVDKGHKHAIYMGTECWSAPEIIENPRNVTDKADIFAYGLVIWEMLTLNIPHSNLHEIDGETGDESEHFGKRPAISCEMLENNPDKYNHPLGIFYCCTEGNPNVRPSANRLSNEIYGILYPEDC